VEKVIRPRAGTAMVEADPEKLLQVVMNLLDNAIKYSPPGGAVEIRIGPAGDARRWFTVRDHGPGLGAAV
jgi:two-component system sensor histidine kinase MprB